MRLKTEEETKQKNQEDKSDTLNNKRKPLIDPDTPVLIFPDSGILSVRECCSGVEVIGSSGSGKTAYVLRTFLRQFLDLGMGGIITLTKPDDLDFYLKLIKEAGRENQLVILEPDSEWVYDFIKDLAENPICNDDESLTAILLLLAEIVQGAKDQSKDQFWKAETRKLFRATINILKCAGESVTFENLYKFIISSPAGEKSLSSKSFTETYCFRVLNQALENANEIHLEEEKLPAPYDDLDTSYNFITVSFCNLADRTRSIVMSVAGSCLESYLTGSLKRMFSSRNDKRTIKPEMMRKGAVVIVGMPLFTKGEVARIAGATFQYLFQQAMLRTPFDPYEHRYVFNVCDEHSFYVNSFTERFQAVARSAGVISFYLNQSVPSYHNAFNDTSGFTTDAFMSNMATKIILSQSDPRTNEYFANVIGKDIGFKSSSSINGDFNEGSFSSSASEEEQYLVRPITFTRLRRGGKDKYVDAVIHQIGRTFGNGLPYINVSFSID